MFRCKQFSVNDSQCAMKVSTDALILGSWAEPKEAKKILDIGCGSGILSLMMLQKTQSNTRVDGIDIDINALAQSQINIAKSPWLHRARIQLRNVLQMEDEEYDFIISNPPYFNESSDSINTTMLDSRRIARHQSSLSDIELCKSAYLLSSPSARLVIMYPYIARNHVIQRAKSTGWYLRRSQNVRSKTTSTPYLTLFDFSKLEESDLLSLEDLVIHDKSDYSVQFKTLCRDFYLRF